MGTWVFRELVNRNVVKKRHLPEQELDSSPAASAGCSLFFPGHGTLVLELVPE